MEEFSRKCLFISQDHSKYIYELDQAHILELFPVFKKAPVFIQNTMSVCESQYVKLSN